MSFLRQVLNALTNNNEVPRYVIRTSIQHEIPGASIIQYLQQSKKLNWKGTEPYRGTAEADATTCE